MQKGKFKNMNKQIEVIDTINSTAFEVGKALKQEIDKNGLSKGTLHQIKRILKLYDFVTLEQFFRGMLNGKSN